MGTPCLLVALLAWPTLCSALSQQGAATSVLERHDLPSSTCADGSTGFFYMAPNTSSNDYIFRLMGGAGCVYDESRCEEIRDLSPALFTSDGWPDTSVGYGLLSGNEAENPLFSTYNRVFVPYCTQDFHLLDTESSDGELQFRGRPYLEETLSSVLGNSSQGSTAVLLGTSAGGVAAFNAVSWLLDSFDQVAELSVILDSSFLFDVDGTLTLGLNYMRQHPSAAYSAHCSEDFGGGPCCLQFDCAVRRGYFPIEDERLRGTFLLSPVQDALPVILDTPESLAASADAQDDDVEVTFTTVWDAATYTGRSQSLLRSIAYGYPAAISVFAPSCMDHGLFVSTSVELWMCSSSWLEERDEKPLYDELFCTFGEGGNDRRYSSTVTYSRTLESVGLRVQGTQSAEAYENLQIDGISIRAATETWWEGRGDASKQVFLFDSCDDLNCNPTCLSGFLPGTRDESDSVLVWVVVLATLTIAMLILAAALSAVGWGSLQGKRAAALLAPALLDRESTNDIRNTPSSRRDLQPQASSDTGAQNSSGGGSEAKPILEWKALSYWLPGTQRRFARWPLSSVNMMDSTADAGR